MTPKIDEILSQKSMFRSSSKCMSGAQKRSETTTQVSEKHQTFPIFDSQVTRRVVAPKSNTGRGTIAQQMAPRRWCVFGVLGRLAFAQGHILRNP